MRTTQQVSINLPKEMVAKLQEMAHKESLRTGYDILYTTLMRKAIEAQYPETKVKK